MRLGRCARGGGSGASWWHRSTEPRRGHSSARRTRRPVSGRRPDRNGRALRRLWLRSAHRSRRDGSSGCWPALPPVCGRYKQTFMLSPTSWSRRGSPSCSVTAAGTACWSWHDRTVRACVAAHEGREIKHEGDGFFIAFPDPRVGAELCNRASAHPGWTSRRARFRAQRAAWHPRCGGDSARGRLLWPGRPPGSAISGCR